jgi:hypothetical protein
MVLDYVWDGIKIFESLSRQFETKQNRLRTCDDRDPVHGVVFCEVAHQLSDDGLRMSLRFAEEK